MTTANGVSVATRDQIGRIFDYFHRNGCNFYELYNIVFDINEQALPLGGALGKKGKRRNREVHEIRKNEKSSINGGEAIGMYR